MKNLNFRFCEFFLVLILSLTAGAKPQYFGYYGSAIAGIGTGNYIQETSDSSNLFYVSGTDERDLILKLEQVKKIKNAKALVYTFWYFFNGDLRLRADYRQQWQTLSQSLFPYSDVIVGFFIADEPFWNAYSQRKSQESTRAIYDQVRQDLTTASAEIKKTFPDKVTSTVYAWPTLSSGCDYVVPNIDWVGVDCYEGWGNCGKSSMPKLLDQMQKNLVGKQKMILFPPAGYWKSQARTSGEMIDLAKKYEAYAAEHSNVIAIVPFLWQSFQVETATWNGAEKFPDLQRYFQLLGQKVTSKH